MIRIQQVSFHYADSQALRAISLDIEGGERVALVGPTGAGKSTLLKCLSGGVPLRHGHISLEGFDIRSETFQCQQRISYLPNEERYWPHLTARQVLGCIAQFRKLPRSHLTEQLKRWDQYFELGRFWDQPFHSLSRGQKRKIAICRVLLTEAPYTLLDDPTEGLDAVDISALIEILQNGPTSQVLLIASHHETFIQAICHRVVALQQGEIRADLDIHVARERSPDFKDIHLRLKAPMAIDEIQEAYALIRTLPQVKSIEHFSGSLEFIIHPLPNQDVYPALRELLISTDWPLDQLHQSPGNLAYLCRPFEGASL